MTLMACTTCPPPQTQRNYTVGPGGEVYYDRPSTPMDYAGPAIIAVGLSAAILFGPQMLAAIPFVSKFMSKSAVQYTKSSLALGQQMHKAYKVGMNGIKEFRLPSGRRIDFLDVKNGIIYKLKPFNPRAM